MTTKYAADPRVTANRDGTYTVHLDPQPGFEHLGSPVYGVSETANGWCASRNGEERIPADDHPLDFVIYKLIGDPL